MTTTGIAVQSLPRPLVVQTTILALGTLQFGLHMAELNTILPYMGCKGVEGETSDCIPGIGDGAAPSSIFAVGGLMGSFVAGPLADARGRRATLLFASILSVLGSFAITFSQSLSVLSFGRLLVGLGAGQFIVVVPIFISEIAPHGWRGRLGATSQLSITFGIVVVQLIGWLWAENHWRRVLLTGLVVAVISFAALFFTVESPLWLYAHKRVGEAVDAASQLEMAHSTAELETDVEAAEEHTVFSISDAIKAAFYPVLAYLTSKKYSKSLATVAGIMILQQFSGINAIVFYGVSILQDALPNYAGFVNLIISVLNMLVTIFSARLIDSLGRKPLLVASLGGMAGGTALLALSLSMNLPLLASFAAILTVAMFAIGVGPIPFLFISEQAPREMVGAAQSIGTSFNWLATFTIGAFFPAMRASLGPSVFYLFTACNIIGAYLISTYVSEEP